MSVLSQLKPELSNKESQLIQETPNRVKQFNYKPVMCGILIRHSKLPKQ